MEDVMKRIINQLACVTLLALLSTAQGTPTGVTDDESNPHLWKSRVRSVAVFKNGLGFFMRDGDVALRDGWCVSAEVPPAAFGTLAIYSHQNGQMVDVVSTGPGEIVEFDGLDAGKDAKAKRARLEVSKLLQVQLTYKQEGVAKTSAGKLVSVGPEYVVLEADSSSYAVPLDGITKMQILQFPVRVHVTSPDGKSPEQSTLGMAYLRKGITWIPEYTLKVLDDDTAELTLRGTLVNEAEDLVHCDVNFVVGVPHFLHTEYLAPVAVGQVIRTIGAAVAPREIQTQIMNRAAFANDIRSAQFDRGPEVTAQPVATDGRDLNAVLGNLPQMEGAAGTDYTVYTKKDLTVRRGEKAIVTLFVKKIRYGHVYRWSPPEAMQHFLVLQNDTDTAWTTGPCLAVSNGNPLSEDLLKYVPKGGKGELPVTTAINIAHEQSESERDRKLKAHEPQHNFWVDLVTIEGTLKVRNFEKTPVDIVINAAMPGKPLVASDDGKVMVDTQKLQLLDRAGTCRWQIKLDPGQSKSLTYQYERYVPSR
jgi:hypothetical protein